MDVRILLLIEKGRKIPVHCGVQGHLPQCLRVPLRHRPQDNAVILQEWDLIK